MSHRAGSLASQATSLRRTAAGFTLIELMIVVAVVAILAAVAYPSYQDQIRKSRRAQAKADLVEYAQLAERFHTANNTYANFTLPSQVSPREGGTARYTFTPVGAFTQANTFTITATAVNGQENDKCGNLSLSNTGVKTSGGEVSECW